MDAVEFDDYLKQCMIDVVNDTDKARFERDDPDYWDEDENGNKDENIISN